MIQFITNAPDAATAVAQARAAIAGGCRWVQLRFKEAADEVVFDAARALRPEADATGTTVIVDDRVELAAAYPSLFDGVHVGRGDMPPADARRLTGPDAIVGVTVNTLADILAIPVGAATYVGMGPYRFTTTKKGLAPVLGIDGYRTVLAGARAAGFALPVVAIGGITPDDVAPLLDAGVTGIAVSGAVTGADDPAAAMRAFVSEFESNNNIHIP